MYKRVAILVVALIASVGALVYYELNSRLARLTPETIAELNTTVALENEQSVYNPGRGVHKLQPATPLRNVYFGDLHVHSAWSFDANLGGNRLGPDEAYAFARGRDLQLMSGEQAQLSVPLDFAAVTDHAESFGLFEGCAASNLTAAQTEFCNLFETPSLSAFLTLRNQATTRPPVRPDFCGPHGSFCVEHGRTTWRKTQAAADRAYEPGVFTTFYGYEYSPSWPKRGSTHRNVIFRNQTVPDKVVSAYDAPTAPDLWAMLEASCIGECDFLTIPHNLNRYYGKAFARVNEDGGAYSADDWRRRAEFEPVVEMFQAKGASECAIGVGTTDEQCAFEQFFPTCDPGQSEACAGPGSFARDGLKFGLTLEQEMGNNPLRVGFVGSTDTHNSTPGDTEEWDYRGKSNINDASAQERLRRRNHGPAVPLSHNPGGLAAIWAEENSRDALFDGLMRKETYATSGVRIKLRFFASWSFADEMLAAEDRTVLAYAQGVPMGGVLQQAPQSLNPHFLVVALRDPLSTGLSKIQMVKGWLENGEQQELVIDIACADGQPVDSETGLCPKLAVPVNLETCQPDDNAGARELAVLWQDQAFDPGLSAFYYVRVLQAPTCRWSTYDAIRLGVEPIEEVPALIQERAWSSPIWYEAG